MGFDDEDFKKAKKVNSDTQLYKQADELLREMQPLFDEVEAMRIQREKQKESEKIEKLLRNKERKNKK